MIKSVYFGCGVITLTERQIEALKKLYEGPILEKLRLTKKFPRDVMYISKEGLGLGLLSPETCLAVQQLKLYFGNNRVNGNTNQMIRANEAYTQVMCGRNKILSEIPDDERYWKRLWIDSVHENCRTRNIFQSVFKTPIMSNLRRTLIPNKVQKNTKNPKRAKKC